MSQYYEAGTFVGSRLCYQGFSFFGEIKTMRGDDGRQFVDFYDSLCYDPVVARTHHLPQER